MSQDTQDKFTGIGEKMQTWGCMLTCLLTLPILGTLFLGVPGLIGGIALGVLLFFALVAPSVFRPLKNGPENTAPGYR